MSIEQLIQNWEVTQGVVVSAEVRRKITHGYQPRSQRECSAILTTIRAVRPEHFSAEPPASSSRETVVDID